MGAAPHRGAARHAGEGLRASPEMASQNQLYCPPTGLSALTSDAWGGRTGAQAHPIGSMRIEDSCDIEQVGR
jgi:hypothetical protein